MPITPTPLPNKCNCDGSLATAYYNSTADCEAAEVWVPYLDIKGDLNWSVSRDKTENTPRGPGIDFKTYSVGKADNEVTFDRGCSNIYEGNLLLDEMGGSPPVPKDWLFLDDSIDEVGAAGLRGCYSLFNDGANNPSSGNSQKSITFAPAAPCTGCKCPVRKVMVISEGSVDDVVSSATMLRVQGLSVGVIQAKQSLVSGLSIGLGSTIADVVSVQIDEILTLQQALGKSFETIRSELEAAQTDDGLRIRVMQQKKRAKGYVKVKRAVLGQLVDSLVTDVTAKFF